MNTLALWITSIAVPLLLITAFAKLAAFVCGRVKIGWKSSFLFAALTVILGNFLQVALKQFPSIPTPVAIGMAGVMFAAVGAILIPQRATDSAGGTLRPIRGAVIGALSWVLLLAAGFLGAVLSGLFDSPSIS